ncbi:MAG TPA: hypothetical protein VMZ92_06770 [Planctomycetota bacterium]|nr:hypothetical protein [Planctomycetota bacterium]
MKEVIERMLKVEEEARGVLAEAEARAAKVAEESRREATGKGEKLRSDAHAEAARLLEETRKGLDQQRQERLTRVDEENTAYAEEVRTKFPRAVDLVVRRVIGG